VTDRPQRALCHDCPARARLCSHSIEAQMRDEPEPPIAPPERNGAAANAPGRPTTEPDEPDGPVQLSLLDR
ncbi:MAG: hypothetical protein M3O25_00110, partial [Actinomycetota bacterium]|nr:hypothetical protein [Actinomycetota bacterium]